MGTATLWMAAAAEMIDLRIDELDDWPGEVLRELRRYGDFEEMHHEGRDQSQRSDRPSSMVDDLVDGTGG